MPINFQVFQLAAATDLTQKDQEFFQELKNQPKLKGEHGYHFCITRETDFENHIVCGCFSEEHPPVTSSVDDQNYSYILEEPPYLNTFFAIDLREKRVLIQHREYPVPTLKQKQTFSRLHGLIKTAFEKVYGVEYLDVLTGRPVSDEEFIEKFRNNRTTLLKVELVPESKITEGFDLFEDKALNKPWALGWNSDTSDTYEILLKAQGRGKTGDLRDSPIANTLIGLETKRIIDLNYWDANNEYHSMSRSSLEKFSIDGVDKNTLPISAIQNILKDLSANRGELRNFKVFDL